MHPVGIGVVFLAFGLVMGAGLFVMGCTIVPLVDTLTGHQRVGMVSQGQGWRQSLALLLYVIVLLLGMAMIVAGGYASYIVVYG